MAILFNGTDEETKEALTGEIPESMQEFATITDASDADAVKEALDGLFGRIAGGEFLPREEEE